MRTKTILLSLAGTALICTIALFVSGPTETVCHKGRTIKVSKTAVAAHLAHGDTLGACD